MNAFEQARENLRLAHDTRKIDLAAVLVHMLTPAGALSEWDSETIENVLAPAQDATEAAGIPWIGSADDEQAHRYWGAVAADIDVYTDYEDEIE